MIDELIERLENNLEKLQNKIKKYNDEPNNSFYTINEIIVFKETIEDIEKELRIWDEY